MQNTNKSELLQSLIQSWKESPHPTFKISSYFPAYVELFGHLVNKKCTFIETGVLDGGSLFMWKRWLGSEARIIGVDLNPEAAKWRDSGFEIYIGDQGDPEFWRQTFEKIGAFDAILDDGGHQSFQQIVTTVEALKFAKNDCKIVIEDTLCSFMKDFSAHGKRTFLEYSKDATDILTCRSEPMYKKRIPEVLNHEILDVYKNVYSIQFYNSMVAFHISKDYSQSPELMRNQSPIGATDFRYNGVDHAYVNWPLGFKNNTIVKVCGGRSYSVKLSDLIKKIVPKKLKKIMHDFQI